MTRSRAISLAAVIAIALGVATGLSHVGHSGISGCNGSWESVLGHAVDQVNASTVNTRAAQLVPNPCLGYDKDPQGGWFAVATLGSETAARVYTNQLIYYGFADLWGFRPYFRAKPTTPVGQ